MICNSTGLKITLCDVCGGACAGNKTDWPQTSFCRGGGGVPADECFIAGFVCLRKAIKLVLLQEEEEEDTLSQRLVPHMTGIRSGGGNRGS